MGRVGGALVGLKHVIGPTVLPGEGQIRIEQVAPRWPEIVSDRCVLDVAVGSATGHRDLPCAIVSALERGWIGVAHMLETPMGVLWQRAPVEGYGFQRHGHWRAALTGDAARSDVVAVGRNRGHTGGQAVGVGRNGALRCQVLKQIVRGTVFLDDDNNVFDLWRKL